MFNNNDFIKRIQCPVNDKEKCIELIDFFVKLSEETREKGFTNLEFYIENFDDYVLRKGIKLIIQGIDPELVRIVLERVTIADDLQGLDFLKRCITIEGILSIQSGDNPSIVRDKLSAFLGSEIAMKIEMKIEKENKTSINVFIQGLAESDCITRKTSLLEEIIPPLSDKDIKEIIKRASYLTIGMAAYGAGSSVRKKLFLNTPAESLSTIISFWDNISIENELDDIIQSQEEIYSIFNMLKNNSIIL